MTRMRDIWQRSCTALSLQPFRADNRSGESRTLKRIADRPGSSADRACLRRAECTALDGSAPRRRSCDVDVAGVVERVPIDEYVRVAILSEFAPRRGDPGVDSTRSWRSRPSSAGRMRVSPRHASQGFDFCSTTHCQLYDSRRDRRAAHGRRSVVRPCAERPGRWCGSMRQPARRSCSTPTAAATPAPRATSGVETSLPYLVAVVDDGPAEAAHGRGGSLPRRPRSLPR